MKYADVKSQRIQEQDIPEEEPIFLVRAQDAVSGNTLRAWADLNDDAGGDAVVSGKIRQHAVLMDDWAIKILAE